ncbi:MAG: hypothetical protein KDJ38_13345 [Gammaproteobacteria bacterium]|nr:hypothetical protein [Gammaproteobacteria bacterium]
MSDKQILLAAALCWLWVIFPAHAEPSKAEQYHEARWDPIHFSPAIESATNEQCLACHQDVLDREVLKESPAGLQTAESLAWYQTLRTYAGEQDTFHRRHMKSAYAQQVMTLKCNTCHQGNDPREEVSESGVGIQANLTMRKQVDPYVCVMCHGQNNYTRMGLPEPWIKSASLFGDNCLTCHLAIKTERHQGIEFLNAEKIEELGAADSDVCYGCHGGRAWYRIWFPYSEKQWPGEAEAPIGARHKYPKPENPSTSNQKQAANQGN